MSEQVNQEKIEKRVFTTEKGQVTRWMVIGVIALSGYHLKKLLLHENKLTHGSIPWDGIAILKSLTVLSSSKNQYVCYCFHFNVILRLKLKTGIKRLPTALGLLTSLKELDIANNELECIPFEIGSLNQLQVLKANNNRICMIDVSIGKCTSLVEIDLSSNLLVDLPETFGNLFDTSSLLFA